MVSPAVNVLRYTALAAGVLYGFQHQRTLYKKVQEHKEAETYAHKEALIRKAKEEYKKKTSPPSGVITDPEDSRFDLEKFLQYVAEQKH